MTEPPARPESSTRFDDPTRDIRLPPAPGSPPLVVRPEWSTDATPPAQPDRAPRAPAPGTAGPPTRTERLASEPTDELMPPRGDLRQPTVKFEQGVGGPLRLAPVTAAPSTAAPAQPHRGRRWPMVVLTLIPVLVIVVSGIWLFVLSRG